MPDDKGVRLTGMWLNETKTGKRYFKGKLGAAQLLGWLQTDKKNDKAPDLVLVLYPDDREPGPRQHAKPTSKPTTAEPADEMPF